MMFQSLENEKPELLATLLVGVLVGALLTGAAGLRQQPEPGPDDFTVGDSPDNGSAGDIPTHCPEADQVAAQNVAKNFLELKYSNSNIRILKTSFRRPQDCSILIDYTINGTAKGTVRIGDGLADNRTQR